MSCTPSARWGYLSASTLYVLYTTSQVKQFVSQYPVCPVHHQPGEVICQPVPCMSCTPSARWGYLSASTLYVLYTTSQVRLFVSQYPVCPVHHQPGEAIWQIVFCMPVSRTPPANEAICQPESSTLYQTMRLLGCSYPDYYPNQTIVQHALNATNSYSNQSANIISLAGLWLVYYC